MCDAPELKIIKRLSCFEEICPSELDRNDDEDHNDDQDLMLPTTPISKLIFKGAAGEIDEALEQQQSPATTGGSKTTGAAASMPSKAAAADAGFISTFAELA